MKPFDYSQWILGLEKLNYISPLNFENVYKYMEVQ